jgi:hypothetical protein
MEKKVTMAEAKIQLKAIGFTLSYKSETGEYRVNRIGGSPDKAYYTSDRMDAVNTAKNWK